MTDNSATSGGALAHAPVRPMGLSNAAITAEWIEDMVNRLFKEAKRQLAQIEHAKTGSDREDDDEINDKNVGHRERNANTFVKLVGAARELASLQLELEKRGILKKKKQAANARKSLERKLARLEAKG